MDKEQYFDETIEKEGRLVKPKDLLPFPPHLGPPIPRFLITHSNNPLDLWYRQRIVNTLKRGGVPSTMAEGACNWVDGLLGFFGWEKFTIAPGTDIAALKLEFEQPTKGWPIEEPTVRWKPGEEWPVPDTSERRLAGRIEEKKE